jgi:hypothetical protein
VLALDVTGCASNAALLVHRNKRRQAMGWRGDESHPSRYVPYHRAIHSDSVVLFDRMNWPTWLPRNKVELANVVTTILVQIRYKGLTRKPSYFFAAISIA